MKKGRADESHIARDEALEGVSCEEGIQNKESILESGESQSHSNEVLKSVDRLIIIARSQSEKPCGSKLYRLFGNGPEEISLPSHTKMGRNVFFDEIDGNYRHHASPKTEDDPAARLRMKLIFLEPEPKPEEGRQNATESGVYE